MKNSMKALSKFRTAVGVSFALLVAVAIGAGTALTLSTAQSQQQATAGTSVPAVPTAAPSAALPDFTDLVDRVGPVVVNIRTSARVNSMGMGGMQGGPELDENDPFYDFFRRFFPQPGPQQPRPSPNPRSPREREVPRGVGSGFIVSADGYLMTNAHVVAGADEIIVTMPDRREFRAKLIGADRRTDVAIVKIDATGLPTVKLGDPNKLRVGEWVIAIGSPFGLDNSVTAGIVSAKARETGEYLPFIQTDVAVNPGNSGGPLINMRGEVVGINSQIFTTSGAYAGISFAIPIDEASRVGEQLRASGRVVRGRIGVQIGPVSRDVAEGIGLAKPQGALVTRIEADTPAEKAGIEPGDVILRFDGKTIDRESDLPRIVGSTKPGTRVPMTVWRKGRNVELQITVGEMPAEEQVARRENSPQSGAPAVVNSLGMALSDVPADRQKELKIRGGARVDSVDGAAENAGVRPQDVIVAVNNVEVQSAKQFNDYVAKLDAKAKLVLLIQRGEQRFFIVIRPQDRQ